MSSSHDNWWAGKADELITHGIGSHLVSLVVFGFLYHQVRSVRAAMLGDKEIPITRTDYWPSDARNPITRNRYYDQDIVIEDSVRLMQVFGQGARRSPIIKMLKKATNEAVKNNDSLVYKYLPHVMSKKKWAKMQESVPRLSCRYFSKMFNDATQMVRQDVEEGYRPDDDIMFPLYIVEPGADGPENKFLSLRLQGGKLPDLPDMADTRFLDPTSNQSDPEFLPGDHQMHADRYRTIQNVYGDLNSDDLELQWLQRFGFKVRTGRVKKVAEPPPEVQLP